VVQKGSQSYAPYFSSDVQALARNIAWHWGRNAPKRGAGIAIAGARSFRFAGGRLLTVRCNFLVFDADDARFIGQLDGEEDHAGNVFALVGEFQVYDGKVDV
jgi:hypothetical protein